MPEMGRPITAQQMRYKQVTMGPKSSSQKPKNQQKLNEKIINKATGYKPQNELFKEGPHNQMGKDEFLKLLTFQLQHQDPMNPMDQGKMTGELAQFSQLEQLANLNKKFDQATKTKNLEDKFYAASFVGKKIVTSGSSIRLERSGDEGEVLFKLDKESDKVLIRILDDKNNIIGEMWKNGMSPGSHQVTWDGVSLDGSPAVKGQYKAVVKAWDQLGNEVSAKTQATGVVTSVNFDQGEPVLTVDGQRVYLRDVNSFHVPDEKIENNAQLLKNQKSLKMNKTRNGQQPQQVQAYTKNNGIYD